MTMITTITIIIIIVVNNTISTVLITCLRFVEDKESSEVCSVRSYNYHRKAGPHLGDHDHEYHDHDGHEHEFDQENINQPDHCDDDGVVQTMPSTRAEKDLGVPSPELKFC